MELDLLQTRNKRAATNAQINVEPLQGVESLTSSSDFTRVLKKELLGRTSANSSAFKLSSFNVITQVTSGSSVFYEGKTQQQLDASQNSSSILESGIAWRNAVISSKNSQKKAIVKQPSDYYQTSTMKLEVEGDIKSWKTVNSNYFQKEEERKMENIFKKSKSFYKSDLSSSSSLQNNSFFKNNNMKMRDEIKEDISLKQDSKKDQKHIIYEEKILGNGQKEMKILEINPEDSEQQMFKQDLIYQSTTFNNHNQKSSYSKTEHTNKQQDMCDIEMSFDTLDTSFFDIGAPSQEEIPQLEIKITSIKQYIGRKNYQ